jgi:hypothetical protein
MRRADALFLGQAVANGAFWAGMAKGLFCGLALGAPAGLAFGLLFLAVVDP